MNAKFKFNTPKLVSLLCLAVLGNAIYFVAFMHGHTPSCGTSCLIFFNVAFLSQFIPLWSRSVRRSGYLVHGQSLICAAYFVVEVIAAIYLLKNDVDVSSALILQMCAFGLFLFLYFFNESANHQSAESMEYQRNTVSPSLSEAKSLLMVELADAPTQESRDILRSAISELSVVPMTTTPETVAIEMQILQAAETLVDEISESNLKRFSRLMSRRRNMLIVNSQN